MGTDIAYHLASPYGQPMASIYALRLGKNGTLAIWSIMFVIQFGMGMSITLSCSRQIWAFSRDNALPMSRFLKRVTRKAVPIYAVWGAVFCSLILGLLALINTATAQAIFAIAVLGTYAAYVSPFDTGLTVGNTHFCKIGLGWRSIQTRSILPWKILQTCFHRRSLLHDIHDHHSLLRIFPFPSS